MAVAPVRRSPAARATRLILYLIGIGAGVFVFSRLVTLGEETSAGPLVPPEEIVHLHGIGVNPGDDRVYLATHTGVLRVRSDGRAERVADRFQDTMGFTVVGPDEFLGSGHPDLREEAPARLGLIRSGDAADTWSPVSLSGDADLHALTMVGDVLFAADATERRLLSSDDGGRSWATVSTIDLSVLAVAPDGEQMVGASADGAPLYSLDGGRSWSSADGPALSSAVWDPRLGPVATSPGGAVLVASFGGREWDVVGSLGGENPVLTSYDGELRAATEGGSVLRSSDGGQTWKPY